MPSPPLSRSRALASRISDTCFPTTRFAQSSSHRSSGSVESIGKFYEHANSGIHEQSTRMSVHLLDVEKALQNAAQV